jgi:hypothetical protein
VFWPVALTSRFSATHEDEPSAWDSKTADARLLDAHAYANCGLARANRGAGPVDPRTERLLGPAPSASATSPIELSATGCCFGAS